MPAHSSREYMRKYMRDYHKARRKQLLELKHAIEDLENLVHKGV